MFHGQRGLKFGSIRLIVGFRGSLREIPRSQLIKNQTGFESIHLIMGFWTWGIASEKFPQLGFTKTEWDPDQGFKNQMET